MKKILFTFLLVFLFTGCASTVTKTNTLKGVEIEPGSVEPLPVTADLRVSSVKAKGEASGTLLDGERLTREALAMALSQNPPSVKAPDVLVGMNTFTEINGTNMKLTLTGYPAYYANFRTATEEDSLRLSVVSSGPVESSGFSALPMEQGLIAKKQPDSKSTGYFSARYYIDDYLGFGLEYGTVSSSGFIFGFAIEEGFSSDCNAGSGTAENECINFGLGFNVGKKIDGLPNGIQVDVGTYLGFWYFENDYIIRVLSSDYWGNTYYYNYDAENFQVNFVGPYAKLRWNIFEVGYRMFLGYRESYIDISGYDSDGEMNLDHQLMFGVTF